MERKEVDAFFEESEYVCMTVISYDPKTGLETKRPKTIMRKVDGGIATDFTNEFIPYENIVSIEPYLPSNSQILFTAINVHIYNLNKQRKPDHKITMKERNSLIRNAFNFARKHGYKTAISHYINIDTKLRNST